MVLQDNRVRIRSEHRFKNVFKNRRVLIDDRGEGDDVDHALLPMFDGVTKGESQRRERLSPPGGNGEREQTGRLSRRGAASGVNIRASAIDFICRNGERRDVRFEQLQHPMLKRRVSFPACASLRGVHESFRRQEIGIDQRRKDQSREESCDKRIPDVSGDARR